MLKSNMRTTLAVLHDAAAAALAWSLAYLLRFNFDLPAGFAAELRQTLFWIVPLQMLIFWRFGLYRGIWRYASTADLRRIVLAVALSAAAIPLLFWMLRLGLVIPRSVLVINPLLLILLMGGSRFIYRLWKEQGLYGGIRLNGEPVLVLGAGDAAASLSKELSKSSDWRLVGFLDDNAGRHGRTLNGIRVLGGLDSLPEWAERLGVSQVIIAMPSSSHQQRKRAIQLCNAAQVKVLTVPSFDDLMSGKVAVSQLRAIELDDLLGRDPVKLDDAGLHGLLTGKVVMVTGAGGSIGSELCRQIARFAPAKLVLFEQSEFALYTIEQELQHNFSALEFVCLVGDVRDAARVDEVVRQHPDVSPMYGRNEHPCLYYEGKLRADEIPCSLLAECPHRVNQDSGETYVAGATPCPYLLQKYGARSAKKPVVATYAFYLYAAFFGRQFEPAAAVVDEAHGIAKSVRSVLEFRITDWKIDRVIAALEVIESPEVETLQKFRKALTRLAKKREPDTREADAILSFDEISSLIGILEGVDLKKLEGEVAKAAKRGILDPRKEEDRQALKQLEVITKDLRRYIRSFKYSLPPEADERARRRHPLQKSDFPSAVPGTGGPEHRPD